jgi:hypothetical protein
MMGHKQTLSAPVYLNQQPRKGFNRTLAGFIFKLRSANRFVLLQNRCTFNGMESRESVHGYCDVFFAGERLGVVIARVSVPDNAGARIRG